MEKQYTAIAEFEAPDHGGVIKTWDVLTLPEELGRKWVKARYVKEGVHEKPEPEPEQPTAAAEKSNQENTKKKGVEDDGRD